MSRIVAMRLHVPRWEQAVEIPDSEVRLPAHPPPDLKRLCDTSMEVGHLLVATYEAPGGIERPYAISGAVYPYYAYHSPPKDSLEVPGVGRVKDRYGFFPSVPETLADEYDIDPSDAEFLIYVDTHDRIGLFMETDGQKHLLGLGDVGDPLMTVMMRVVVIVHILDALEGIRRSDVLPYDKDTHVIAHQRIAHVLRWQFKSSRTRPLFA